MVQTKTQLIKKNQILQSWNAFYSDYIRPDNTSDLSERRYHRLSKTIKNKDGSERTIQILPYVEYSERLLNDRIAARKALADSRVIQSEIDELNKEEYKSTKRN